MKNNWIWILLGVTLVAILTTYFVVFNGKLSVASQDWASFGGYVSGIMMPILTSINIWVFVNLTRAIDNNNETRIKDKATIEESRYKEEVIFRKRKIITDFRHQEIRYFEGLFLKIGQGQDKTERCNIVAAIQNYLTAFRQTNQHLFTCEDALFDKMNDLKEELTNI